MTAIITDLTIPTGIQMSGEAISGSIAFNGTTQFLSTTTSGLDTTNQSPLGGSIYFNGTTASSVSYPAAASLNLGAGAGNWTIECWYYALEYPSSWGPILQQGWSEGYTNPIYGFMPNSTNIYYYVGTGAVTSEARATPFSLKTWYHLAMVRQGNAIGCYLNGVLFGSYMLTFTMGSGGNLYLSTASDQPVPSNSYVNNVRIVKGQAVYSFTFTTPTTALTAVTGTQLLVDAASPGAYLTDGSTNNFTLTPTGTVTYSSNPPTAIGGQLNFSSSYLTVANNTVLDMASGDFTIEFWFQTTTASATLYTKRSSNINYSPVQLVWSGSAFTVYMSTSGSAWEISSTTSANYPSGAWYHVALVRNSNNIYLYVNGISAITPAAITVAVMSNSDPFAIGSDSSSSPGTTFTGYMTNFRIVKGTAVYTSNFTVPTSPLTAISGTSLLLSVASSGTYITDTSGNSLTVTNAGGVTYSSPISANPVSTGGSLYLNPSTSAYITLPSSTVFNLTGDFTIESWIYPSPRAAAETVIIDARVTRATVAVWKLYLNNTGKLTFAFISGSAYSGTITVNSNVWTHVAAVRSGSTLTLYVNGVADYTNPSFGTAAISPGTTSAVIGTKDTPSGVNYRSMTYITNLRVVTGTAIYNSPNFTPSTLPLPSTQSANIYGSPSNAITGTQTSLLLNTPIGASFLNDSSSFNHTPTNGGNATSTSNTLFYSNPFTVELWWNPSGSGQANGKIFQTTNGDSYTYVSLALDATGNNLEVYMSNSSVSWNLVNGTSFTLTTGTWYHIALVYDGTTIKLYLNGTGTTLATVTTFINPIGTTVIGGQTNGKNAYGLISNVRVMNGVAAYTSDFAPPIGPLSITQNTNQNGNPSNPTNNVASTNLMLNTVNNSSYLTDSSYFKNTITANASPTSSPSNPYSSSILLIEYLVVGGGGSGASSPNIGSGGGGAGGFITNVGYGVLTSVLYTITIGAGGAGINAGGGNNGANSSISYASAITALGGGTGGYYDGTYVNATSGGSGGGSSWNGTDNTHPGAALQPTSSSGGLGYAGGNGGYYSGGGGGGAGEAGHTYPPGTYSGGGGAGGDGVASSITGSSVYYAGGGGGGSSYGAGDPPNAPGGLGGGGQGGGYGGYGNTGNPGSPNTGGGGGGSAYSSGYGGNGGSGIVIIKYPDSYAAAYSTTGSPTINVTGGYRIYTWTSSGSIIF